MTFCVVDSTWLLMAVFKVGTQDFDPKLKDCVESLDKISFVAALDVGITGSKYWIRGKQMKRPKEKTSLLTPPQEKK